MLEEIKSRYNPEFDMILAGPKVTWAEYDLYSALMVLVDRVKALELEIKEMKANHDAGQDRLPLIDPDPNPGLMTDFCDFPSEELTEIDKVDDRSPWIPAAQLPPVVDTGWVSQGWSDRMIVCQFIPNARHPTLILASYDFDRGQWRTAMGPVAYVTYWQPVPEFPKEYHDKQV